jgi:hypothetical protein
VRLRAESENNKSHLSTHRPPTGSGAGGYKKFLVESVTKLRPSRLGTWDQAPCERENLEQGIGMRGFEPPTPTS